MIESTLCLGLGDRMLAVARQDSTIYVGGLFSMAGPSSGGGPVDRIGAATVGHFPRITGQVLAVVGDGHGGWYVGGIVRRRRRPPPPQSCPRWTRRG